MKKKSNLKKIPVISKQLLALHKKLYIQAKISKEREINLRREVDKTLIIIEETIKSLEVYNFFYHVEQQFKKEKK